MKENKDGKRLIINLLKLKKYREAADQAEILDKLYPDDPEYSILYGAVLLNAGKYDKMVNVMKNAVKRFPSDWKCFSMLGDAYGYLEKWSKAEEVYLQSLSVASGASCRERARLHCSVANVQWIQRHRDDALAQWREALAVDPTCKEAQKSLKECTNEYQEPAAPSKVFDDPYHFQRIHTEKYLLEHGKKGFKTINEAERVIGAIYQAWNDRIAPRSKELDAMTAAEKTELFESVSVDFSKPFIPRIMPLGGPKERKRKKPPPSKLTKDEMKVIKRFDRQFDFLPSMGGLLTLTYGIPAFFAYGWTEKRMKEIVAGSRLTEDESIIFLWAYTIVDMVLYTDRVEGSQDEIEFIREAVDIAEEYLSNESAVYVVNRIRVLVENKNNGNIG